MAELPGLSDVGINISSGGIINFVGWFFAALLIIIFIAAIGYWYFVLSKYKYKIIIFENLSGEGYKVTGKDKAMLKKLGNGGQHVLYLRKRKVVRPAYGQRMGPNTYWFAIAPDGYWHNVVLKGMEGDKGVKIETIDPAMQYEYVALEQALGERYDKKRDWVPLVMAFSVVLLVLFIGIIGWLWFERWAEIPGTVSKVLETEKQVLEELRALLGAIDNSKTGGSGLVPAIWRTLV